MSAADYAIREARVHERALLMNFLEQYFFPREYLLSTYLKINKCRIDEDEERLIVEDMRRRHTTMLEHLPCLVAVHQPTDTIVGLNLMLLDENPAFADVFSSDGRRKPLGEIISSIPQHSKLLANWFSYVLDASDESVDFFSEMPSLRSVLKLVIVCVDPKHSGRGLATGLLREAVNYATSQGIGLVSALFTSALSRKAAEKNGFVKFNDLDITHLRDNQGNVIYEGTESYVISVMAKVLNKDC